MRARLRRELLAEQHMPFFPSLVGSRTDKPAEPPPPSSAWLRDKAAQAAGCAAPPSAGQRSTGMERGFGHLARVPTADWQAVQQICAEVLAHSPAHD